MTKCGHAVESDLPDWHPDLLELSIERSLKRLRTDYLDVVHLHSCSEEVLRKGDVVSVLERARTAGKTRFIGYSGDGNAALYAINSGTFDTLQISINIADQDALQRVIPAALEAGIGIIAKRPIANAVWRIGRSVPVAYVRPYWDRLARLDYHFLNDKLKNAVATALRFTITTGIHTAIVGTTSVAHWRENADAVEAGPLSPSEFGAIADRWREIAPSDWIGQQ